MPDTTMEPDTSIPLELERLDTALRSNAAEVLELTARFVAAHPDNADGWIFRGRALQINCEYGAMLEAGRQAARLAPANPVAQLLLLDALLASGDPEQAFRAARVLESQRRFDPEILNQIGGFYAKTNRHHEAARVFERLRVLKPGDPRVSFSLAAAYTAINEIDKAEKLLDEVLKRDPHEYDAYYNRASLRKQKPERNHVAQMEAMLREPMQRETGETVLCYSLAKELEDLREWKKSFRYLKRGADARRRSIDYDKTYEFALLDIISETFGEDFFRGKPKGYHGEKPIFVLGMPRSGTTLVDRILSSHSQVGSIGESSEFSIGLLRACGSQDGKGNIPYAVARTLNFEELGRDYCRAMAGMMPGVPHVLDKTPSNFMILGLIAAALPDAPIIHLRRNPIANCYAIYKTLFRTGYNFSYNLEEMAQYYLAYLKIMKHWRTVLPGRFLDIDYEKLVADQETESRRLLEWCGLPWEDAVLSFEKNASPSLTASAGQVRQPIYDSSVEQWRHYEEELQPMIQVLKAGGVDVG